MVRRVPMCVPICVPMCVPKQVHIYDGSGTAGRQGILFNRLIFRFLGVKKKCRCLSRMAEIIR